MADFQPMLNHVAILVKSVELAAEKLRSFDFMIGPTEKWPGEGTLEIYVGESSHRSRLLLMEPYQEGAYSRALSKRGPGLHHIAIDVNDLKGFIENLSGSGWLLHPKSVKSISEFKTAWLARPGVPALIEVQQRDDHEKKVSAPRFITEIGIPVSLDDRRLIQALSCADVVASGNEQAHFKFQSRRIKLSEIL